MGVMDTILGNKGKDNMPDTGFPGMDTYAPMAQQGFDPSMIPLLQGGPQGPSSQMAQFMTDNESVVAEFRDGLRGWRVAKVVNEATGDVKEEIERFADPAMNETGVMEICRDLSTYLSKPFIMSNFPTADKRRIDLMMKYIGKNIAQKLIVNAVDYDLDKTRRGSIVRQVVYLTWANAMRSFEDGERPRVYGSQKTVQTISQSGNLPVQPQKKSWFGMG